MESKPLAATPEEKGVIYLALGSRRYLVLCACSVQSLRWAGYEGAIRVLVDDVSEAQAAFSELNVELVQVKNLSRGEMSSRDVKTRLYDYAPWPQALYLDCDIIVLRDPAPLWDDFGSAALAMRQTGREVAKCNHGKTDEIAWTLQQGVDGMQFNGGVMLWRRCEETRVFFQHWHAEWQRFKDIDQLALLRAINSSKAVVQMLPKKYNCANYDSTLQAMNAGFVFWHALGGRDVAIFRAAFGTVFEDFCDALEVSQRDLKQSYYALSWKRGANDLPLWKRRFARKWKRRFVKDMRSRVGRMVRNFKR